MSALYSLFVSLPSVSPPQLTLVIDERLAPAVKGEIEASLAARGVVPSSLALTLLAPARAGPYACNHAKVIILEADTGVRVAVATANLLLQDWELKNQGVFVQDFPSADVCAAAQAGGVASSAAGAAAVAAAASPPPPPPPPQSPFQQSLLLFLRGITAGARAHAWPAIPPLPAAPAAPAGAQRSSPAQRTATQTHPSLTPLAALLRSIEQADCRAAKALLVASVGARAGPVSARPSQQQQQQWLGPGARPDGQPTYDAVLRLRAGGATGGEGESRLTLSEVGPDPWASPLLAKSSSAPQQAPQQPLFQEQGLERLRALVLRSTALSCLAAPARLPAESVGLQCSSIGNLSQGYVDAFTRCLAPRVPIPAPASSSSYSSPSSNSTSSSSSRASMSAAWVAPAPPRLVWPSVLDVAMCVEGYEGGRSLPVVAPNLKVRRN